MSCEVLSTYIEYDVFIEAEGFYVQHPPLFHVAADPRRGECKVDMRLGLYPHERREVTLVRLWNVECRHQVGQEGAPSVIAWTSSLPEFGIIVCCCDNRER